VTETNKIAATELPERDKRPLWQFIRLVNSSSGKSALLLRVHHCIGDGISLVSTMCKMFHDAQTGAQLELDIAGSLRTNDRGGKSKGPGLLAAALDALTSLRKVASMSVSPHDSVIKFGVKDREHLTMANTSRIAVIFPAVSLDFIKAIKNAAGVTVNDVLLAATVDTIARYCVQQRDPLFLPATTDTSSNSSSTSSTTTSTTNTSNTTSATTNTTSSSSQLPLPQLQIRALMAVAFPRPKTEMEDPAAALRNQWAFTSVELPMRAGSARVLRACSEVINTLKRSSVALIQLWLQLHCMPWMPLWMQRKVSFDAMSRHSLLFSNVPGFQQPILLCGEKLLGGE
jgi:hypothetical protein